jgi:hypothetical protein
MTRLVTSLVIAAALSIHGAGIQERRGAQLQPVESVAVETLPDLYVERDSGRRTFLFVSPWQCDSGSNIYFVPATPETLDRPDRIVRISPDGKLLTLFPRPAMGASSLTPAVRSRSIGPDGRLHVLVQTEISESIRQRIVSFTPAGEEGAAVDAIHVPTLQIVGQHFALVGTGDVVVLGRDPQAAGERLALVSRKGTVSRDVHAPEGIADTSDAHQRSPGFTWLGSGSDGLAYLVRERARRVVAISPAGEVVKIFDLPGPEPGVTRLSAVHVAGDRMAAVYRPESGTERWIQVQDLVTGALIGTYGPVANPVVCYQRGEPDTFTLLSTTGDVWRLTRAAAP